MNDQTTQLIEKLAQKMGTTSEYLWQLLLSQAPISATLNLVYLLIAVASVATLIRLHIKFSNDENKYSYYNMDDKLGIPMTVACILVSIYTFVCLICCPEAIITGYLNPEYWALDRVLSALK